MRATGGHSCDRVIVFGRYPEPGKTKTRLIPALGPVGAADLQRRLTERTLNTVSSPPHGGKREIEFCYEGGSTHKVLRWIGKSIPCSRQSPGDLGERIYSALKRAFKKADRRVVLVGTDIPGLTPEHVEKAFDALRESDVVLGPSTDGGYWLIGMKRPLDLFTHISWSTRRVLEETQSRAKDHGVKVHLLDTLRDIDTFEDLRQSGLEMQASRPYITAIIPVLNEGKNVVSAVRSAQCQDAQVIVVDGGSHDDTAEKASDAGALLVRSPRGRALQQNKGAEMAAGRVLLFLHADTVLPGGYVNHVFDILMDKSTVAGAFLFRSDLSHPFMRFIELMTDLRTRILNLPYGDQALFVRREVFRTLGGFPDVPIAEDLYLVSKLSKLGKVGLASANILTSGRKWQREGIIRNSLINVLIAVSWAMGISPGTIKRVYRGNDGSSRG